MEFLALLGSLPTVAGLVLFVLKGFAIYEMSDKLGLKNGFLGFIPVVSNFQFGKIAEKHLKKDGSVPAKFSIILLILAIIQYIILAVFIILFVFAIISIYGFAKEAVLNDSSMFLSMFSSIIPVVICYFVLFAITIAYTVLYYIAFWKICNLFDRNNTTLFTVLSVVFPFLLPIFLFVMRNNITYERI